VACPLQAVAVLSSMRRMMGFMTEPERDHRTAAGSAPQEAPAPPTEAQREYDTDPALRELLTRAARSPTVRRARRVDDRAAE